MIFYKEFSAPVKMTDFKAPTTEKLFEKIGNFGLYQVLLLTVATYASMCWGALCDALVTLLIAEPRWRCAYNSSVCNITGSVGPGEDNYEYRCGIPRQDWQFVDDYTSLVTQFDLVCGKSPYAQLIYTLLSLGGIVGSLTGGITSDIFGRKKTVFASGLVVSILVLAISFSHSLVIPAVLVVFVGIGCSATLSTSLVLVVEYVGIKQRSIVGNMLWFSFAFGYMIIAGIGYLVRDWRTLTRTVALSGVPIFATYCFFPDSLRWLIVKKRVKQAKQTIKTIIKVNKKRLDENEIQLPTFEDAKKVTSGDVRLLFSSGYAVTTLVVWYTWFVNSLVYCGVNLSAPSVGGSTYFNWFISGLAEFLSECCAIYCHNRFGRKKTMIFCQIIAALSSLGAVILTLYDNGSKGFLIGKILMSMILAKFFITLSFNGICLITAELYPTVIRNVAQGTGAAATNLGRVGSAYVSSLIRVHPLLPYGIMGINALISGLLCLNLKETNNQPILEVLPQEEDKLLMDDLNQNKSEPVK